jgi:hypothetical protein
MALPLSSLPRSRMTDADRQGSTQSAATADADGGRTPPGAGSGPGGAFDDILIDARGLDSEALRIAVSRSDLPVMPVQPCAVDVWALVEMAGLIGRPNQRRGERGEDIAGDDDRDRLRRLPRSPSA